MKKEILLIFIFTVTLIFVPAFLVNVSNNSSSTKQQFSNEGSKAEVVVAYKEQNGYIYCEDDNNQDIFSGKEDLLLSSKEYSFLKLKIKKLESIILNFLQIL